MTVTKDQAQLLTTLAIACRPHRAPTWDEAGVMAAIQRVKDKSLSEVALAVIRAASDREAQTPGTISALNGSAWQEQLKPPLWQPTNKRDDEHRCTECGLLQADCVRRPRVGDDDHKFLSIAANRAATNRSTEVLERLVVGLREAALDEPPARPVPEVGTEGTSRVTRVRVALHEAEEAHAHG